ncbi:MAG TPA: toll/interleukin-1 receptor domain-containing protein [Planctomycetaceae bacterium]|jgi:hypothetical protein|nr:toll/interleukin-1 receptor domain-containing protein [Planctomycetaceae bacterium]
MRAVRVVLNKSGKYLLQLTDSGPPDAIAITFDGGWHLVRRKEVEFVDGILPANGIDWIWKRGKDWYIDLNKLKQAVESFKDIEWLSGVAAVEPELRRYSSPIEEYALIFTIYEDEYVVDRKRKVFLSHKGVNKRLVRQYFDVLKQIGFDPWLDEDALTLGDNLERGIRQGFADSCAAAFFITPEFKDEKFLASEIDYALAELRDKDKKFKIIAIVFKGKDGKTGVVPPLLKPYVYMNAKSHLKVLREILRGLPIEPGELRWRADIAN